MFLRMFVSDTKPRTDVFRVLGTFCRFVVRY